MTNFLLKTPAQDFGSDLIARNLQRARDHAIPGYSNYRELCGLSPLTTWNNRPSEIRPEVWVQYQVLYEYPQDIDLFTGGISEYPVPDGVTGRTFNCLKVKYS